MPFRLKKQKAQASFQRLMEIVLADLRGKIGLVYLNDTAIFLPSIQQHFQVLNAVMEKLCAAGLTLHLKKSHFCLKEIRYSGHVVSADQEKVNAIKDYPVPTNQECVFKWSIEYQMSFDTLKKHLTSQTVLPDQNIQCFLSTLMRAV